MFFRVFLCFLIVAISLYLIYCKNCNGVFLWFVIVAISLYLLSCKNCSEGLASLSLSHIFSISLTSLWVR
ncbi:hypothetical protein AMTRI_Chr06g179010 [Amborella trichopoda]